MDGGIKGGGGGARALPDTEHSEEKKHGRSEQIVRKLLAVEGAVGESSVQVVHHNDCNWVAEFGRVAVTFDRDPGRIIERVWVVGAGGKDGIWAALVEAPLPKRGRGAGDGVPSVSCPPEPSDIVAHNDRGNRGQQTDSNRIVRVGEKKEVEDAEVDEKLHSAAIDRESTGLAAVSDEPVKSVTH